VSSHVCFPGLLLALHRRCRGISWSVPFSGWLLDAVASDTGVVFCREDLVLSGSFFLAVGTRMFVACRSVFSVLVPMCGLSCVSCPCLVW
jgi:hypothetical protein